MITLLLLAMSLHDGTVDRPARFAGLVEIQYADGRVCVGAGRVEDLPTRGFVNRWHYLIAGCPAENWSGQRHTHAVALASAQQITVAGWATLTLTPLDPEVRDWCKAASLKVNDYPNGWVRTVTVTTVGDGLIEILIEQPGALG